MSDVLRPYRDLFPQIGQRVMIDDSSVVIGDAVWLMMWGSGRSL